MKTVVETNRLRLRPFKIEDAEEMFYSWTSDPEVTKYVTWNVHQSIDETRFLLDFWIKQYEKPERINFAIELKEGNVLIGGIDVVGYLDGIPVVGYVLSRKHWNNGYMTEALRCMIELLFSLGHNEIIVDAIVENIGSNKVIVKCGGIFIETYSEFFSKKNTEFKINRYKIIKSL